MFQRLPLMREAAINFVHAMRPGDRAAVVLFAARVRIAQEPTSDKADLESAIRTASPNGATALHEALYVALRELARMWGRDGQLRRQAIVVLTDGDDNRSRVAFEEVLAEARRNSVTVYTIVPPIAPLFQDSAEPPPVAPHDLRTLAVETGGRSFGPTRMEELSGAYGEIAEELSRQYWLAYVPTATQTGFRRVSVRIENQPTLRARTRSGYFLSAPKRTARAYDGRTPQ
jgi:VWFA-related protein